MRKYESKYLQANVTFEVDGEQFHAPAALPMAARREEAKAQYAILGLWSDLRSAVVERTKDLDRELTSDEFDEFYIELQAKQGVLNEHVLEATLMLLIPEDRDRYRKVFEGLDDVTSYQVYSDLRQEVVLYSEVFTQERPTTP
jgi:hypothetical protein